MKSLMQQKHGERLIQAVNSLKKGLNGRKKRGLFG